MSYCLKHPPLLQMRFQTITMKQRLGDSGRCVQYIQIVCVCMKSQSLYCSRSICIYLCTMLSDYHLISYSSTQVIMNERAHTGTLERSLLFQGNNARTRTAHKAKQLPGWHQLLEGPKKKHRTAHAAKHTGCKQRTRISSKHSSPLSTLDPGKRWFLFGSNILSPIYK